ISDYAVDRCANFRVAELRLRALILAFGRFQLSFGGLKFLLLAKGLQFFQMLLRDRALVARRDDVNARLVEFFPRQRALIEKLLAALENFFLGVEGLLRLLRVGLGLLNFFWKAGACGGFIRGLLLLIGTLCVLYGGGQVAILQH